MPEKLVVRQSEVVSYIDYLCCPHFPLGSLVVLLHLDPDFVIPEHCFERASVSCAGIDTARVSFKYASLEAGSSSPVDGLQTLQAV